MQYNCSGCRERIDALKGIFFMWGEVWCFWCAGNFEKKRDLYRHLIVVGRLRPWRLRSHQIQRRRERKGYQGKLFLIDGLPVREGPAL